jgi:hypothetical protein
MCTPAGNFNFLHMKVCDKANKDGNKVVCGLQLICW